MVYVLRVCVWDVRFVFWCCVLCMCIVGAGVGAQCVVCGVCGVCAWCVLCVCGVVCVLCVWRGLARGKPLVCRFKTSPCAPAPRAHVEHMRAFYRYTRRRFEPTHGDVSNLHNRGLSLSLLSFSLSLVLSSLSLPSYFSLSLSLLSSLLSSLSATMTMITRPVGSLSLSVNTALTCLSVRVRGPWPIPCWPNMFASCRNLLSWHNCANLVPLGTKWACICAANG